MRPRFFFCILLSAVLSPNQMHAQPLGEKVLFRKALSDGRELVVIQEPMLPTPAMKDLMSADKLRQLSGFFSLAVEVRSTETPLRLWSQLKGMERDSQYNEFQVLDLLVLPNRLIMTLSGSGSSISVIEIFRLSGPSRFTSLQGHDWSLIAVAGPFRPGRLGAKLSYNEEQKRIDVEVTDFLDQTKQHTLFEQKGDEWEFVRVKRWEEKIPATQPAPVK